MDLTSVLLKHTKLFDGVIVAPNTTRQLLTVHSQCKSDDLYQFVIQTCCPSLIEEVIAIKAIVIPVDEMAELVKALEYGDQPAKC